MKDIIICGHTHCGAMTGLLHPEKLVSDKGATLSVEPGEVIEPAWPELFEEQLLSASEAAPATVAKDSRAQLAAIALGGGNLQFSLYLVALCGMGMLATTGVIVSEDTFGPVSDNAAGIAEMSGEFHGPPERIMVSLDAVGNTTKAVTKGFAIGSAVIASVAIFASFIETAVNEIITVGHGFPNANEIITTAQDSSRGVFDLLPINVADPKVFIGLLIGGAVPFLFSALAINAVSRTAGVVVQEVRRQFADGLIMKGEKKPDHGPVIDICTAASLTASSLSVTADC